MIRGDQNRTFHYAVLASLALHALLLLGFPDLINSARRAVESFTPPIVARLMAPEPAGAPPAAEEKPPPPVKKPKAAVVKPVPAPQPAPERAPVAPVETAPAPPSAEPPAPVASEPALASAPSVAPAPPAAQPGAPSREARTIDEYRLELIEAAKRIKDRMRYPPDARDNNWTGTTQVSVAVPPQGRAAISVKGSSGHQVLDRHALTIFRQAAQEVPVPQELRGQAFVVEIPMLFTLTE